MLHSDMMTTRIIGHRVITVATHFETITVPVSAGKRMFYNMSVQGNRLALIHSVTSNSFAFQVDPSPHGSGGQVFLIFGEY